MQYIEMQIIYRIDIENIKNSINWACHKEHHQAYRNDPYEFAEKTLISIALYEEGNSV